MAQRKTKGKKRNKNSWRIFLIIFIFGYIFFRTVPSLFAMAFKVVLPEKLIIEDKVEVDGIILKKESLYKSETSGHLEVISSEGDRISKGAPVCTIQLLGENLNIQQELRELDDKILRLENVEEEKDIVRGSGKKIGEDLENLVNEIQEKINIGQYEEVEILKDKLDLYHGKQQDLSDDKNLISTNIENLRKQREELYNHIKDSKINYYANEAGIVSYKIDGYEEIFSFSNKEKYNYSDFKVIDKDLQTDKNMEEIKSGDIVFKIIDNFEWYAFLKIEDFGEINSYEEGDTIVLGNKKLAGEFKGKIVNIKKDGKKGTILCRFNTGFHKIYDERFVNFDIIKYKYNGYKIPTRAIVDKDGVKGVYIKEISGIIKFRPIEIIKEEDKFTYVNSGDNNFITIKGENQPVKTITKFDEILLNTKNIKEGMIIY